MRWRTHLEHSLAAAVKLHAEADAAGFTGAGELAEQSRQDRAGQSLLQQRRLYERRKNLLRAKEQVSSVNTGRSVSGKTKCVYVKTVLV